MSKKEIEKIKLTEKDIYEAMDIINKIITSGNSLLKKLAGVETCNSNFYYEFDSFVEDFHILPIEDIPFQEIELGKYTQVQLNEMFPEKETEIKISGEELKVFEVD
jgi:hypothetical protein